MSTAKTFNWNPWRVFTGESSAFALVVLNSPITSSEKLIELWKKASYKVLVDGGANRWYKLCQDSRESECLADFCPDEIVGDFDSIDPKVLDFFKQFPKVKVTTTPDQNHTDFTKALKLITAKSLGEQSLESIIAYAEGGSNTGRPDQVFANYNSLFQSLSFSDKPVFLISPKSIEWLLPIGINHIEVPEAADKFEKVHCGLIPLLSSSRISTTGFRWDVTDSNLQFGQLVSTSNEFDCDTAVAVVEVFNQPILFTLQTKPESPF